MLVFIWCILKITIIRVFSIRGQGWFGLKNNIVLGVKGYID